MSTLRQEQQTKQCSYERQQVNLDSVFLLFSYCGMAAQPQPTPLCHTATRGMTSNARWLGTSTSQ